VCELIERLAEISLRLVGKTLLIGKDLLFHFPELALRAGGFSGFSG
jgi:hypothetical protein